MPKGELPVKAWHFSDGTMRDGNTIAAGCAHEVEPPEDALAPVERHVLREE